MFTVKLEGFLTVEGIETWEQVREILDFSNKRFEGVSDQLKLLTALSNATKPQQNKTPPWESN